MSLWPGGLSEALGGVTRVVRRNAHVLGLLLAGAVSVRATGLPLVLLAVALPLGAGRAFGGTGCPM